MKKLFYLLIATIVLISCGNGSKNKTETNIAKENQTNRVEVLYFHGAQRCITCRAIEANTVALLDSLYSKEQTDGKIIFKVIDISKKENEQIADKYEVTWSSLFVNGWKDSKENVNNMTEFSFSNARNEIVVIDTAPTGHTLLLLDATQSYHKEVERTQGEVTGAVANLLPRLRNPQETEVVIVTLPEATPVFEAERLQMDLQRAGINNKWWVVNACLSLTNTANSFLQAKAQSELTWIKKVEELSKGNTALIEWKNL